MADPQGNPVCGPVFRTRVNLPRCDAKVTNHSAHPVEVQTHNGGALVKCLMPGIAQPFNGLVGGFGFEGRG
jgi:hypothetical protein